MDTNEKCPDDSAYIQPITTSTLLSLGIYQSTDIVTSQNWIKIIAIYIAVIGITFLVIYLFGVITKKGWHFDLKKFEFNRTIRSGEEGADKNKNLEDGIEEDKKDDEYVDPDLFKEIYN